jgi:hypothetical protein
MWLSCLAIQGVLICALYPSHGDFVPVKTYSGKYMLDVQRHEDNSCIGGFPIQGGHCVYCGLSFDEAAGSCGHKELDNQFVTAEIARYRNLFGQREVLVRLSSNGKNYIDSSEAQLIQRWIDRSEISAILNATIVTIVFSAIRRWRSLKKTGNPPVRRGNRSA